MHDIKELIERGMAAHGERIKTLEQELGQIAVSVNEFAQKSTSFIPAVGIRAGESLGAIAVRKIDADRDVLQKSGRLKVSLEIKAASDPITAATSGQTVANAGAMAPANPPIGLHLLFNQNPSGMVNAVSYSRHTGQEGVGGIQQGEGASKSALRPTFVAVQQAALTAAAHATVSKQVITNNAELSAMVSNVLGRGVYAAMDSALWSGNTIPDFDGISTIATAHESSFELLADAISDAAAAMIEDGYRASAVALHPATWVAIKTARATDEHYLEPTAYGAEMTPMLRGLPVILSAAVPIETALVADGAALELQMNGAINLTIGYVDDQMTKNLVTMLAEVEFMPIIRSSLALRHVTAGASTGA